MTTLEIKLLTWLGVSIMIVLTALWIATWRHYDFGAPSSINAPASPPSP